MDERERGLQVLAEDATGCILVFVPTSRMFQPLAALAVLAGLFARKFSGVCEYYLHRGLVDGAHVIGVGLAFPGDDPDESWWSVFVGNVRVACEGDEDIHLDRDRCEFATVGELRATMLHAGTAGFADGLPVWVSDPAGPDPKSPFTVVCRNVRSP
jgi:hypothetical protein